MSYNDNMIGCELKSEEIDRNKTWKCQLSGRAKYASWNDVHIFLSHAHFYQTTLLFMPVMGI